MKNSKFVHLHVHNEYSLLDGLGTAEKYVAEAKELGFESLALSNHANVDGVIKFQKACVEKGIKPIHGCEAYIVPNAYIKEKGDKKGHILLLAKNKIGFENIMKMLSFANIDGFYSRPRIDYDTLLENLDGLVVTTACVSSFIRLKDGYEFLEKLMYALKDDFYLETQSTNNEMQREYSKEIYKLHKKYDIPMIVTSDCHYIKKSDVISQEVLLAIQRKAKWKDKNRFRFTYYDLYLKSANQTLKDLRAQGIFSNDECKQMVLNTKLVAEKCNNFLIEQKQFHLPQIEEIEETDGDENKFFKLLLKKRFKAIITDNVKNEAEYKRRMKHELNVITKYRFVKYFLIVWELINFCEENDIMVGPGRGSVGGCLIAYILGITKVDPIKHGLLFERFISPGREDLPDIDVDFEDKKRHIVKQHLEDKYGVGCVAGVSTFLKMKARMVLRDVARVFDVNYLETDTVAKLVETKLSKVFDDTIQGQSYKRKHKQTAEIALNLEGQIRGCVSGNSRVLLQNNVGVKVKKVKNLFKENFRGKIRSYDFSNDVLFFDDVINIVNIGKKEVINLYFDSKKITLTKDHRVLTDGGWVEAGRLKINDKIAANGVPKKIIQTPWNKGLKGVQTAWNKGLTKDDHQSIEKSSERWKGNKNPIHKKENKEKLIKRSIKLGCLSGKLKKQILDRDKFCNICKVKKSNAVHHKDENKTNNSMDNLQGLCFSCHSRHHNQFMNILNENRTIHFVGIKNIEDAGIETVFDIEMNSINKNFVCNSIVVHNSGQHAAAVIIANERLDNGARTSLSYRKGALVVNWDKKDAEFMGMLKLDVLALSSLSRLKEMQRLILRNHDVYIDFDKIDINNKILLEQFSMGNSIGCFQFGTYGLRNLCKNIGIDSFETLATATALYRPAPLHSGMTDEYVERKHGKNYRPVCYKTHKILKDTQGIIVYQEQTMRIANEVAGFSMKKADQLRKILDSDDDIKIQKMYKNFINGCMKNKLSEMRAKEIWNNLSSYGGYGFNRCLTGDTTVIRSSGNQYGPCEVTIKKLYEDWNSKTPVGKKYRSIGLNILQYDDDERIRPGKLVEVIQNGLKHVYEITTKDGFKIKATSNHKFLTNYGYKTIASLKVNDCLVVISNKDHKFKRIKNTFRAIGKTYDKEGFYNGKNNPSYIDGRCIHNLEAKLQVKIRANGRCEKCNCNLEKDNRPEFAHINSLESVNGNYKKYHNKNNMLHLCNSCHKTFDYEKGERKTRYTKGKPSEYSKIKSIKYVREEMTYDLVMNTINHNFIANGIVSHNSHAYAYTYISIYDMYVKHHYPAEFICASLTYGNPDNKTELIDVALRNNLSIMFPKVSSSRAMIWETDGEKLYMPFIEIKGIGEVSAFKIEKAQMNGFIKEEIKGNIKRLLENISAYEDNEYPDSIENKLSFDLNRIHLMKIKNKF